MGNVYNNIPPEQPYDNGNGVGAGVIVGVILAIIVVLAVLWIIFAQPFSTTTNTPSQPNSGQTINVNNPPSTGTTAQPTAAPSGTNNAAADGSAERQQQRQHEPAGDRNKQPVGLEQHQWVEHSAHPGTNQ